MAELTRSEVTISYSDEGDGAAVVLLHGHTFDRRIWRPVLPALLDGGCRILRPDLRGHGLSSRPDRGYHVSHHAADLIALLDALEIGSAALVGLSFGGGVALEAALTHPGRVAALGLISTTLPDRPFEPVFMDNLREVARTIRSHGVAAAMAGPWLAGPLFARSFARPGVRETVAEIVASFPGAEFLAAERDRVERGWTVPDRLGEISVLTRVMVGEHELPGFCGYADEIAAAIPGATLDIVADCGHLLPIEAPEAVAEMIIELCEN